MLKILQARLQQYMNWELPDVQAGFRKGRGTRDQIANICWIIKKAKEFQKSIYFCFIAYTKAFDCVDCNKLWKILKEMGIPDHLTCLLRNLYAGHEVTISTVHGTTDWFQIGKGVCQGYILSPCLFNLYAEYSMWNAGLDEATGSVMRLVKCSSPFILIKYPQQRKVLQPRSVEHSASGMDLVAQPEMRPHTCARNTPFLP